MNLNEKAKKTVQKLLKLTRDDQVTWNRSTETRHITTGTEDSVRVAYTTRYESLRFRVYEARFQVSPDGESVFWSSEPRVEIIDFDEILIWRLPMTTEMWDLLQTIEVKSAGIDMKLDEFLNEE